MSPFGLGVGFWDSEKNVLFKKVHFSGVRAKGYSVTAPILPPTGGLRHLFFTRWAPKNP